MIKIDFKEPATAEWKNWRERAAEEQKAVVMRVRSGEKAGIKERLYKGQKDAVYMAKHGPFFGKCAYCEGPIYEGQPGDIEHYRPKGGVTEIVTSVDAKGKQKVEVKQVDHPGYYWLCYEWTNLLPSCRDCNSPSKAKSGGRLIGKANFFPVEGARAAAPGEEALEKPLLINPVFDDPDLDIALDPSGTYKALTPRGRTTIDLLGLNDRELPGRRARVMNDTRAKLLALLNGAGLEPGGRSAVDLVEAIREIKEGRVDYSAAARIALADLRTLILDFFGL